MLLKNFLIQYQHGTTNNNKQMKHAKHFNQKALFLEQFVVFKSVLVSLKLLKIAKYNYFNHMVLLFSSV